MTLRTCLTIALGLVVAASGIAQETKAPEELRVSPSEIRMQVGESVSIEAAVLDADGNQLEDATLLYLPLYGQFWNLERRTWGFNLFKVSPDGVVTASKPGEFAVLVRVPKDPEATARDRDAESFVEVEIPLTILPPPIASIELLSTAERFYSDTTVRIESELIDEGGDVRTDVTPRLESSDTEVVEVEGSLLHFIAPGKARVTAVIDAARATLDVTVQDNPLERLELDLTGKEARTGDVVRLHVRAIDGSGREIPDMPTSFSFSARTDPLASGGPTSGIVTQDGRFVADLPGEYTLVATSGSHSSSRVLTVVPRDVRREVELVGHGRVSDRATSDLWVWEGVDGRDYAITGTHSASGHAYVWDITDPGNPTIIDVVHVDARTVNDVKISEDARLAVISREGASNRRNGIVLIDVSDPRKGVRVLSTYDDELTGGVHNLYVRDNHIYALSGGQRYDVINVEDPEHPHRVGRFELPNPDRSIHDVVVKDGIAYSANWNEGVVLVDVGGGGRGGSPNNPVLIGSFPFPTGWNHAVYPYRSKSTGTFYIFAGDEAARTGRFSPTPERGSGTPGYEGESARWRGWIHILEWNWENGEEPRLVARYEVPEAGSHNIWVEDDVMYVGFYNGGLRIVDVSGELLGNLYRQGREIAHFLPFDPEGFVPNSPQVWGAQPHKGVVWFSDYNSGLWSVRLKDESDDAEETTGLNHH